MQANGDHQPVINTPLLPPLSLPPSFPLSYLPSSPRSLCHEMHRLMRVMWSGKWAVVTPHTVLNSVWRLIPTFHGYTQQDAQEFLWWVGGIHAPPPPPPPPPPPHTHTHTHTYMYTHTDVRVHIHSHTCTHTHAVSCWIGCRQNYNTGHPLTPFHSPPHSERWPSLRRSCPPSSRALSPVRYACRCLPC